MKLEIHTDKFRNSGATKFPISQKHKQLNTNQLFKYKQMKQPWQGNF